MTRNQRTLLAAILVGTALAIGIGIGLGLRLGNAQPQPKPDPTHQPTNTTTPASAPIQPPDRPTRLDERDQDAEDDIDAETTHQARLDHTGWVLDPNPNPERIAQAETVYAAFMADLPQDQWWANLATHLSTQGQNQLAPIQRQYQDTEVPIGPGVQRAITQTGDGVIQVAIPVEHGAWVITLWEQTPGHWVADNIEATVPITELQYSSP